VHCFVPGSCFNVYSLSCVFWALIIFTSKVFSDRSQLTFSVPYDSMDISLDTKALDASDEPHITCYSLKCSSRGRESACVHRCFWNRAIASFSPSIVSLADARLYNRTRISCCSTSVLGSYRLPTSARACARDVWMSSWTHRWELCSLDSCTR